MRKKGWIKIAEAFIAVILIAGFFLLIYSRQINKTSKDEIIKIEDSLLDEIVGNENFRNEILNNNSDNIEEFIITKIPVGLNFTIRICEVDEICNLNWYIKEIYVRERIVSSTLHEYKPKKLKLFVWEK